jgi:hypothetical protein
MIRTMQIGHLQKRICTPEAPLCVHNFAVAGDTIENDLSSQLGCLYEKFPTAKSLENSDRALFGELLRLHPPVSEIEL